jgi:hypothetical protein
MPNGLEEIFAELEQDLANQNTEVNEEETEEVVEETGDAGVEVQEDLEQEVATDEETQEETNDEGAVDTPQARGFQRLRQKAEQAERALAQSQQTLAVFANLASSRNMTLEQLTESITKASLEREAQERDVPVDVLEERERYRKEVEARDAQLRVFQQSQLEQTFNRTFDEVNRELNLSEQEVVEFFEKAGQSGIDLMSKISPTTFKFAYYELYPEKYEEKVRQKVLEGQKKSQKRAPLPTGSKAITKTDPTSEVELDKQADALLKDLGMI